MTTTIKRRNSLRLRITAWVALVSILGLFAAGLVSGVAGSQIIKTRIDENIAREMSEFRALSERHPELGFHDLILKSMRENVGDEHETFLGVLPQETIVPIWGEHDLPEDATFRQIIEEYTEAGFGTYHSKTDGEIRFAVMPLSGQTADGKTETAYFVVAYFLSRELTEMKRVLWIYAIASVVAVFAIAAASWVISSQVLRPLRELRDTARDISATDISQRLEIQGNDEVADLGRTFNDMLDRLKDSLDAQRNMLDDVGHELRTPITIVRGHLELLDESDPDDVETTRMIAMDELDRMNDLVNDVILLAKARRPDFLNLEPVDLSDVVTSALQRYGITETERIEFAAGSLEPVWVMGDKQRLIQAVLQLIDNAVSVCSATDPDSHHTITVGCDRLGNRAGLTVSDTGPGIDPKVLDKIFQRHERGTDAYEGTGLGLAIVDAIVKAHGGSAHVAQTGPEGTTMGIALTAIPAPNTRTLESVESLISEDAADFDDDAEADAEVAETPSIPEESALPPVIPPKKSTDS